MLRRAIGALVCDAAVTQRAATWHFAEPSSLRTMSGPRWDDVTAARAAVSTKEGRGKLLETLAAESGKPVKRKHVATGIGAPRRAMSAWSSADATSPAAEGEVAPEPTQPPPRATAGVAPAVAAVSEADLDKQAAAVWAAVAAGIDPSAVASLLAHGGPALAAAVLRQKAPNAAASLATSSAAISMSECCVCLKDVLAAELVALVPCGHRCVCEECWRVKLLPRKSTTRQCPICCATVVSAIRVFDTVQPMSNAAASERNDAPAAAPSAAAGARQSLLASLTARSSAVDIIAALKETSELPVVPMYRGLIAWALAQGAETQAVCAFMLMLDKLGVQRTSAQARVEKMARCMAALRSKAAFADAFAAIPAAEDRGDWRWKLVLVAMHAFLHHDSDAAE